MEGIQLVISVISVLFAGFALILSVFILVNYRNIVYLSYILLYSALFIYTGYLASVNVIPILAVRFPDAFLLFLHTAGAASKGLLVFCFPFLFHYLYEVPHRRLRNIVWGALCVLVVFFTLIRPAAPIDIDGYTFDFLLSSAAFLSVYCYLLVLFFKYRRKMRDEEIRPLHRVYIVLLSIYMAASFSQAVLAGARLIPRPVVEDALLVPVLFILWNVFFLKFISRFLKVRPIAVPGIDISEFGIIKRSDITEREREIISELLTGATVPAIAAKLFISEHTAKTHVKNIYQKLEVRNRVELYHLIASQEEMGAVTTHAPGPKPPLS